MRRPLAGPPDKVRRATEEGDGNCFLHADLRAEPASPRRRAASRERLAKQNSLLPGGPPQAAEGALGPAQCRRRPGATQHKRTTRGMLAHSDPTCPAIALLGGGPHPDTPRSAAPSPRAAPGAQVVLRRRPGEPAGLTLNDQLVVVAVTKGSAAEAAGIRPGSKVTAVGGRQVGTQGAAVAEMRSAGAEVSVRIVTPVQAPHEFGISAGRPTDHPGFSRKCRVHSSARPESPLARSASLPPPSSAARAPGLGLPGLGPQEGAWGDADAFAQSQWRGRSPQAASLHSGPSQFKPNHSIPTVIDPPQRRALGNKTSYELAADSGCVNHAGHWQHPPTPKSARSLMREEYLRRNHNGDILSHCGSAAGSPACSPRPRGLRRLTVEGGDAPAVGHVPLGPAAAPHTPTGLRQPSAPAQMRTYSPDFLYHDCRVTNAASPGRSERHVHQGHGDITGGRWEHGAHFQAPSSPHPNRGRRTAEGAVAFEAPSMSPRSPVATRRYPVINPHASDIFFHQDHVRGASSDMPDAFRGKALAGARPPSPARISELAG